MASSFFKTSEKIDDEYFNFLNDKMNWFTEMNRNELLNSIDWTCVNRTGGNNKL